MTEAQAVDFKSQVMELAKSKGVNIAEDAAGEVAELALEIVGLIVANSENKYDDMVWAAVEGKAKESLLALVDKIDGEEG
jgi:hypothetical protein